MTLYSLLSARVQGDFVPGVQIQTLQIAQNELGARVKGWVPKYDHIPARIMDPSSDDQVYFERNGLQISHIVYLGDPGGRVIQLNISQGDRILWGVRIFEIVGVRHPDQLRRYFIVGCQEKTPGLQPSFP